MSVDSKWTACAALDEAEAAIIAEAAFQETDRISSTDRYFDGPLDPDASWLRKIGLIASGRMLVAISLLTVAILHFNATWQEDGRLWLACVIAARVRRPLLNLRTSLTSDRSISAFALS